MRIMNLAELPRGPNSVEECAAQYAARLSANEICQPRSSLILTAYMAWPNDEPRRDSFVATYLSLLLQEDNTVVGSDRNVPLTVNHAEFRRFGGLGAVAQPALDRLTDEVAHFQRDWLLVADIFHKTVDIAYDKRLQSKVGTSISKAIDLCENERTLPGHSQLRRAWSDFRDVAHLLTAGAYLTHGGLANSPVEEASILKAIWITPDLVCALAGGFQISGLQPKSGRDASTILQPQTLWQIPPALISAKPFIPFRQLTEDQVQCLQARRASKKYSPAVAQIRGRRSNSAD